MPKIEVTDHELVVSLNPLERIWSLRLGVRVPVSSIQWVEVDPKAVPWKLGVRVPGTFFPGVIAAGTYWKPKNKQFAYWKRGETPVVVWLKGHKFNSLVLGSKDPQRLVAQINAAIQGKN